MEALAFAGSWLLCSICCVLQLLRNILAGLWAWCVVHQMQLGSVASKVTCSPSGDCQISQVVGGMWRTLRARICPTMPCDTALASKASSRPSPLMCEWAPMRSMRVKSRTSALTFTSPDAMVAECEESEEAKHQQ